MVDTSLRSSVESNLIAAPIFGVVRTDSHDRGVEIAETYLAAGLKLIEITFSVPGATRLVTRLKSSPAAAGASIGMGTVTTAERARSALEVDTDFIVSPNVSPAVADVARSGDRFLVLGALTCTEIVAAHELGADLVKVFPLPAVGGPAYLEVVRQPLADIPMLAAGGFGIEEIPAYLAAGAVAFGLGAPLLAGSKEESLGRIRRAIDLARNRATT